MPLVCFGYSTNDKLTIDGINYVVLDGEKYTLSAVGTTKGGAIVIPGSVKVGEDLTFTVVQIGGEGNGWKDVTSVELPNTITTLAINAFSGSSITTLTLPQSLTIITRTAFNSPPTTLEAIYVEEDNTTFKAVDGILYSADGKQMIMVPARKTFESGVLTIPDKVEAVWPNSINED